MTCHEQYDALFRATERLHEIYYQQESVEASFSNVLNKVKGQLISSGLSSITESSAAEVLYALEENNETGFEDLKEAARIKIQVDVAASTAEESYQHASEKYEECIKQSKS